MSTTHLRRKRKAYSLTIVVAFLILSLSGFSQPQTANHFKLHEKFTCGECVNYSADLSRLPVYDVALIHSSMDSIMESGMTFSYPQGACQDRAQVMSMLLSSLNVQHVKVWLFSPYDLETNATTTLFIPDQNQMASNNIIDWNYHVAPCVLVKQNGKLDTLIIDPSLASGPITLRSWLGLIGNASKASYTFLTPEWYFFETIGGKVLTGEFYKFGVLPKYCADNYRHLSLENNLAINDVAIHVYTKFLLPLRNSSNNSDKTKYERLKRIFGDVNILRVLFARFQSYCGATVEENVSLRGLHYDYPDLMTDASRFYFERYLHWIKKVKEISIK